MTEIVQGFPNGDNRCYLIAPLVALAESGIPQFGLLRSKLESPTDTAELRAAVDAVLAKVGWRHSGQQEEVDLVLDSILGHDDFGSGMPASCRLFTCQLISCEVLNLTEIRPTY